MHTPRKTSAIAIVLAAVLATWLSTAAPTLGGNANGATKTSSNLTGPGNGNGNGNRSGSDRPSGEAGNLAGDPAAPDDTPGGGAGPKDADGGQAPSVELPPPAEPVLGERLNVEPEGRILVKLPGSDEFVAASDAAAIPTGTEIDARHGAVTLTTSAGEDKPAQAATFWGARFQVRQARAEDGVTDLVLRGGLRCGAGRERGARRERDETTHTSALRISGLAASKRRPKRGGKRRRLWGDGHGKFRTHGHNSTASVRGTVWLTEDRCNGTLTFVKRGTVVVRDFAKGRNYVVEAGERHLARPAR